MSIRRTIFILLATVTGLSALLSGAGAQMGVDEIRPGMVGIGRTVFDGTRVEEFKVNIVGVLENIIGPHRNLILAKLEGGPLAHTGVIAGMSGSPVYIDGKLIGGAFQDQGFIPTGGGAAGARAGEMPYEGPLKPGDAIGVAFVTGDLQLGGTGTVTHIDGDRVYAFGHPMYNLGPTEFPMTRAYVYTVLPSLFSSMKLSSTGDVIGTFLQDRATTIAGRLGPGPQLIPLTLTLESDRTTKRTFNFGLVNDQLFTPLMAYATILNTASSYERQFGTATFQVRGTAKIKKHDAIAFNNLFSGEQASMGAAAYIVAPITYLVGNDFEKVQLENIDITLSTAEEPKTATLERVWLDDPRPRAGRTVPLKMLLRTYRGDDIVRTLPIEIPSNASGSLSVLVTDGARLSQAEQREARPPNQH